MPRKNLSILHADVVRRPGDAAAEEENLIHHNSGIVTPGYAGYDGGSSDNEVTVFTNSSGNPRYLEVLTVSSVRSSGDHTSFTFTVYDSDDVAQFQVYGPVDRGGFDLDPPVKVLDGWYVTGNLFNYGPYEVQCVFNVHLREEVLSE